MFVILKKSKISIVICSIVIIVSTYFWYKNYIEKNNLPYILGANIIEEINDEEATDVMSNVEDLEKFFRPSKLPILNTNKLIDIAYDKNVKTIVIPSEYLVSPNETITNYFSLLREAAKPIKGKTAGCGSLGTSLAPYKIGYNFFTKDYQSKVGYQSYENSFNNILHINLIKIKEVPTDLEHQGSYKYFYEIETIEGTEKNSGSFSYYYGYIYLIKEKEGFKISDINITPENYLCAPYHGWQYYAESSVSIRYGSWCNLIKTMGNVETDGYIKNVYFEGNDGKEYKIEFIVLTNDNDLEIAQYFKNNEGLWQSIFLNPTKCLPQKNQ